MIELRPFASLGAANHGWLDAHHHFSFADYHMRSTRLVDVLTRRWPGVWRVAAGS